MPLPQVKEVKSVENEEPEGQIEHSLVESEHENSVKEEVEVKETAIIPSNIKVELEKVANSPTTPAASPKKPTKAKPKVQKPVKQEKVSEVQEEFESFQSEEEPLSQDEGTMSNKAMFFYLAMAALRMGEGICVESGINIQGTCDDIQTFKETRKLMDEMYYDVVPEEMEEFPAWIKLGGLIAISGARRYELNKKGQVKVESTDNAAKKFEPVFKE